MRERLYSIDQIDEVAAEIAKDLSPSLTVALTGELGAGKTTLVRALIGQLGSDSDRELVSSPTYVLQHIYELKGLTIEHWDLYRVSHFPDELLEPIDDGVVRLIEWAVKIEGWEQVCQLEIALEVPELEGTDLRKLRLLEP